MEPSWKNWTKNDLIFSIIIPLLVILAIVGISKLSSLLDFASPSVGIVIGITMELLELTIIVAVPLLLGLIWNQWAGGASGFIMGSFYALYWQSSFHGIPGSGTVLLAYVLSPMIIGYMAGALNKRSEDFKRMLIAGVIATAIGGVLQFGIFQLSTANVVTGWTGLLLTLLPRILCGVIIAVLAKVFFWYGMGVSKKLNQ